jgi:hypothetical protein
MNRIDLQSQHGRVPVTDGRSAESRMLKAVRAELVAQIGRVIRYKIHAVENWMNFSAA